MVLQDLFSLQPQPEDLVRRVTSEQLGSSINNSEDTCNQSVLPKTDESEWYILTLEVLGVSAVDTNAKDTTTTARKTGDGWNTLQLGKCH